MTKQDKHFAMQKGKVYWRISYITFLGIFKIYNIYWVCFFLITKGKQYHVLDVLCPTVWSTLQIISHSVFTSPLSGKYYPHLEMDKLRLGGVKQLLQHHLGLRRAAWESKAV